MADKAVIKKPHIVSDKGGQSRVVQENPLVRVSSKDQGLFIVQGGKVMLEDGTIVTQPPQWFIEAYAAMNEEIHDQVGLDPDDLKPAVKK